MYKRILVPLDGSKPADRGLTEAIGLARALGASLRLLYVDSDYPMVGEVAATSAWDDARRAARAYGDKILGAASKTVAASGVTAETTLRESYMSRPADGIIAEANESSCDLIVMGTHGRKGISRLVMGSDASLVVQSSPVPVLLVKSGAEAG
jgi:nucleotide-binding universal stress UspA family protein